MKNNRIIAATLAAAGLGGAFFAPAAAFATTSCPTGSTLVSGSICKVSFTETPAGGTWTPPAGITKLEVLIVGAGGAGQNGYGGGGGDVWVTSDLNTTDELNLQVGIPGDHTTLTFDELNNTYVQQGGYTALAIGGNPATLYSPGDSGNGYLGGWNAGGGANGHGSNSEYGVQPGAGQVIADWVSSDSLFADDTRCFGEGGTGNLLNLDYSASSGTTWTYFLKSGQAVCGASYMTVTGGTLAGSGTESSQWNFSIDLDDSNQAADDLALTKLHVVDATANSGSGGTGYTIEDVAYYDWTNKHDLDTDGAAGFIEIRFEMGGDTTLAATGTTDAGNLITSGAAVGSLIAGAVALVSARRRKA